MKKIFILVTLTISFSSFAERVVLEDGSISESKVFKDGSSGNKITLKNGRIAYVIKPTSEGLIYAYCESPHAQSDLLPNYQRTKSCVKKYALKACKDSGYDDCKIVRAKETGDWETQNSQFTSTILTDIYVQGSNQK